MNGLRRDNEALRCARLPNSGDNVLFLGHMQCVVSYGAGS